MKSFFPVILTTLYGSYSVHILVAPSAHDPIPAAVAASPIADENRDASLKGLPIQRRACAELGLFGSTATLDKISTLLSDPSSTYGQLHALGNELRTRLNDELFGILFFSLDGSEAALYSNPIKDWEWVIRRWPKTQIDIEESARCYACSHYAAAIFHALLVAELGVIEVAKLLGVAGDKPGWGALDRLERVLDKPYKDRSIEAQKHSELLENVTAHARDEKLMAAQN